MSDYKICGARSPPLKIHGGTLFPFELYISQCHFQYDTTKS